MQTVNLLLKTEVRINCAYKAACVIAAYVLRVVLVVTFV